MCPRPFPPSARGYDILMEKPISPDLAQCKEILAVARETGRKVVVCHVLRYAPSTGRSKRCWTPGSWGS